MNGFDRWQIRYWENQLMEYRALRYIVNEKHLSFVLSLLKILPLLYFQSAQLSTAPTDHQMSPLRHFLLTTSIKGVPRLMKSSRLWLRILWTVFVMSGFSFTFYLVTKLFLHFFAYGVTMVKTEYRDPNLAFPGITLCNLNPFANINVTDDDVQAYMDTTRDYLSATDDLNIGNLFDTATVFANVATDANTDSIQEFLVVCRWDMRQTGMAPCKPEDIQISMFQASLGYCFTITPPATALVAGFSAILYLDDSFDLNVPVYKLTLERPLSTGALLVVHPRDTLPNLPRGAVLLAGRNSLVNINVLQRSRQPHPYSNCTYQTMLQQAPEYRYTRHTCENLCTQTAFITNCGCIGTHALFVPGINEYNGEPLCGVISHNNLSRDLEQFIDEQHCCREVVLRPGRCDQNCPAACEETQFILSTESTFWPHPTLRLAFWEEHVENKPYSHRFQGYRDVLPSPNDTPAEMSRKKQWIKNDELLTENFLQVIQHINCNHYKIYSKSSVWKHDT